MRTKYIRTLLPSIMIVATLSLNSCEDFLDKQPPSNITPERYLNDESQLAAYATTLYSEFQTPGFQQASITSFDDNTDNQASIYFDNTRYAPGQYRVSQTGGDWDFTEIRNCNYFLEDVLPKWKEGAITGNKTFVDHYVGEVYFLRAYAYFKHLQATGDFPIIRKTLPDNREVLTAASQRAPRNEVARFILSDLDSAIMLLQSVSPDGGKNRISKLCAQLFSSRVALYEATWEKYFNGTAFVPNGPGWPGKDKDYNAGYSFPSGSIEGEVNFFLDKALENAMLVADAVPTLVPNSGHLQQSPSEPVNPYYDMFAQTNMSAFSEVLLWRRYDIGLGIVNGNNTLLQNGRVSLTRGMVDGFLMKNGLPIYDPSSGYAGDDSIPLVRMNRDERLQLFLKEPGQKNVLFFSGITNDAVPIEPYPPIVAYAGLQKYSATGYNIRKGLNFDDINSSDRGQGHTGTLVFRAAEAYLNYIEASYEKNGSLDAAAQRYWQALRTRAGIDPDYNKTIAATNMSMEARNDWGAYSAGTLVDATLYNIRRERRCELMSEGLRNMDLLRWRAMDQMITTPYHIEGFKLWGPMQLNYPPETLQYGRGDGSNVSDPALSPYLRPYQLSESSLVYNGYRWNLAHYLRPIAVQHFLITAGDGSNVSTSPIYQNPGWPIVADQGPI